MPLVNIKTTNVEEVWKSPDGKMNLRSLTLEFNGKTVAVKSYSDKISQVGFEGEVETYEKPNKQGGTDTFVKQPQKDNYQGGNKSYQGKSNLPGKQDNYTMYLSYVKDIAVALIAADKYSVENLASMVEEVGQEGKHLYDLQPASDEDLKNDAADMKAAIDEALGKTEEIEGETPWTETPQLKI